MHKKLSYLALRTGGAGRIDVVEFWERPRVGSYVQIARVVYKIVKREDPREGGHLGILHCERAVTNTAQESEHG